MSLISSRKRTGPAYDDMIDRFLEALDRGLWTPRSNSARFNLEENKNRVTEQEGEFR